MISWQEAVYAQREFDQGINNDCSEHAFSDEEPIFDWNGEIILLGQDYWKVYEYHNSFDYVIDDDEHIHDWLDDHSYFYDKSWFVNHFGKYSLDETIEKLVNTDRQDEKEFFENFVDVEFMEAD